MFQRGVPLLVALFLCIGTVGVSPAIERLGVPDPDTIEYPDGEPPSAAEVNLGKILFFDTRLSSNQHVSCASCHNPDLGFGWQCIPRSPHRSRCRSYSKNSHAPRHDAPKRFCENVGTRSAACRRFSP